MLDIDITILESQDKRVILGCSEVNKSIDFKHVMDSIMSVNEDAWKWLV